MKPTTTLLSLTLFLYLLGNNNVAKASDGTNTSPVPDGWLNIPSRELILDVQQKGLEFGTRQDSGEFLITVLNTLLQAGYTIYLSDGFIQSEINYYHASLERETPPELSKTILGCLEGFRASGVLDWNCFKSALKQTSAERQRHLPWLAPPIQAKSIRLAAPSATNIASLTLTLEWAGLNVRGGVLYGGRFRRAPGQSVLLEGNGRIWAFSAVMHLTNGTETVFEKTYEREEWKKSYSSAFEQPLWKTSEALVQDIKVGLRPKPASRPAADAKKSRKRAQSKSDKKTTS